jgi:O-antigen/teichoic acid export membrane protein
VADSKASAWRGRGRGRIGLVFFDQVIVSGCSFLTMLVLIRSSGLELYGAFGMVLALAMFIVGLQLAFISQPMMSIGPAQSDADRPGFFGSMLVLQLGFTTVAAIATAIAYMLLQGVWADPLLDGTLLSGSVMILARQGYVFVRNSFFATGRVARAVANDSLAFGGQLVALALLGRGGPLELNTVFWTVGAFFGLALVVGLMQFGTVVFSREALTRTAARNWRFSRWLGVQSVFQWFSSNAIFIASGSVLGSAAVGALKLAQNVVGILGVVLVALENFVPVDAARAFAGAGMDGLKRYLKRILFIGGLATAGVAACIMAWPAALLQLLSAVEPDAWTIGALRWFALLYLLAFVVTVQNIAFRSVERTRELALCHILISLPMLVAAHPVVVHFGFTGACVALVLHKAVLCICLATTFRWTTARIERQGPGSLAVDDERAPATAA